MQSTTGCTGTHHAGRGTSGELQAAVLLLQGPYIVTVVLRATWSGHRVYTGCFQSSRRGATVGIMG